MKHLYSILFLVAFSVFGVSGQTTAAYVSDTTQPWNQNSIILGMNEVYPSDWTHYFYPTVNANDVFVSGRSFVFVEGGNSSTTNMLNFLNNNMRLFYFLPVIFKSIIACINI